MANKDTADSFYNAPIKSSPKGQTHLLAIAIDDYEQCSKLNNAVLDVEAFIELVTTRYTLERQNITLIKDAAATKKGIESAFDDLIELVEPQDNLIVYFSGHGRYHERRGGYWVPVDAGKGDKDWTDYLSNGLIKDYLSKIKSFHTFLIADSCFSGTLFIDKSKEKFSGDRRDTEPSRWGLTSGKKEIVSDGQPGQHSPFAIALLDVLRKADQPIGVMRICDLVLEKVAANAQQTPMGSPLQVPGHQGGQMVLYFREDEASEWQAALATTKPKPKPSPSQITPDPVPFRWKDFVPKPVLQLGLAVIGLVLVWVLGNQVYQAVVGTGADPLGQPTISASNTIPKPDMITITGGTFEMGDLMGDKESNDEKVHTVTVSDFMIAKTELTFEEYDRFCEATKREKPSDEGWGRGKRPVINVSWEDATAYCNWLSEKHGLQPVYSGKGTSLTADWNANGYRLPTEAEWEYAARAGGKKVRFGNGKDIADPKEINFDGSESNKRPYSLVGEYLLKTVPVGSLNSPNALGLHDMSGNVWEWCWDWFAESYYSKSPAKAPYGPTTGELRVLRGCSWLCDPYDCRAAYRFALNPTVRDFDVGFRLVRH